MAVLACLVVAGLLLAHGIAGDVCSRTLFSCDSWSDNPCEPVPCVAGKYEYPGLTPWRYVHCSQAGAGSYQCEEKSCDFATQVYDPASTAEPKCGQRPSAWDNSTSWGYHAPPRGLFDIGARCYDTSYVLGNKYNCRRHNPCISPRCNEGISYYPGKNEASYVYCNDTAAPTMCQEEVCPDYHIFDVSSQTCIMDIDRCSEQYFNCKEKNPCLYPRCDSGPDGIHRFQFHSRNRKYVKCVYDSATQCNVTRCAEGTYNPAQKLCQ